jgi:hypothetical protein
MSSRDSVPHATVRSFWSSVETTDVSQHILPTLAFFNFAVEWLERSDGLEASVVRTEEDQESQ